LKKNFDSKIIKNDFPIFKRKINDYPLVYLDNAATTQKPQSVIDSLISYYQDSNANVFRGVHTLSVEATDLYDQARQKVQRFIKAKDIEEIIYTRNTSESINLVAYSWALKNLNKGDKIFISPFEHHSNLVPWQQICRKTQSQLLYLPLDETGSIDCEKFSSEIDKKTKLISVTHMSNVLGEISPIKDLTELAHRFGALIMIDGAQSVPHMPIDVQEMNCDFLAFSSHKMLGPTGIGILYAKKEILEAMDPFLFGGDMIREVTYEDAKWNDLPYKFEAGTPNIADAIATGVAIDYLENLGMDNVLNHEKKLVTYALERFSFLENIDILGTQNPSLKGGVISFNHKLIHPHDLGTALDRYGIAIRTGHHCAMPLIRSFDLVAACRASFYIYNDNDDIDKLIDSISEIEDYFINE
jgi:cysteine desulfurase/selenocysteine lyase